jgi:hypothetical protein
MRYHRCVSKRVPKGQSINAQGPYEGVRDTAQGALGWTSPRMMLFMIQLIRCGILFITLTSNGSWLQLFLHGLQVLRYHEFCPVRLVTHPNAQSRHGWCACSPLVQVQRNWHQSWQG